MAPDCQALGYDRQKLRGHSKKKSDKLITSCLELALSNMEGSHVLRNMTKRCREGFVQK